MTDKELYAHTSENKEWQTLTTHLEGVALKASGFAIQPFSSVAYNAGLWHDVGKATAEFQARLRGATDHVEHSGCGAKLIDKFCGAGAIARDVAVALEYVISGHHSGLPDYGTRADNESMGTLMAKLAREFGDCSRIADKLALKNMDEYRAFLNGGDIKSVVAWRERFVFSVRYLYSLLTDADYLDTEEYALGVRDRIQVDFALAEKKLHDRLDGFPTDTAVRLARKKLQHTAYDAVDGSSKIFTLDMPTGSGKTLAGLSVALKLLRERNLKRIIYIIPYTSILDQTANEFYNYFDADKMLVHHSNVDYEELRYMLGESGSDDGESAAEKLKKSTENWDAPVVLTTNVRFFESIYSNRSSALRKLHNMAESVLVFDEIHTLPTKFLQPCLNAVNRLTSDYGSVALFMTATMPDFDGAAKKYCRFDFESTPLITDKSDFGVFSNCNVVDLGSCDDEDICRRASEKTSALIIVNSREHAAELYAAMSGNKVHLSTAVTPKDREKAFERIRAALKSNEKITVVSTSLVEAGVDLDFESVFRESAGLDNILQAAGRCNREGKRQDCTTYVFKSVGKSERGELGAKVSVTNRLMRGGADVRSSECIMEYFDEVYRFGDDDRSVATDSPKYMCGNNPTAYNFATYAEVFKLIENDNSFGVVIPDEEIEQELNALRHGGRANARKLRYRTASVTRKVFEELCDMGAVERVGSYAVLALPSCYSSETGLTADVTPTIII